MDRVEDRKWQRVKPSRSSGRGFSGRKTHSLLFKWRVRKRSYGYPSFRVSPWRGQFNFSPLRLNPLEWFGNKRFVLAIVFVALLIGGIVLSQGPLFHNIIPNPNGYSTSRGPDPSQALWTPGSAGSNDLSTFKTINALFSTVCQPPAASNCAEIELNPNSTTSAVALSKSPISDLSTVNSQGLLLDNNWYFPNGCCGTVGDAFHGWAFYLTRNGTLPTQKNYDPFHDSSVVLAVTNFQFSAGNFGHNVYMVHQASGATISNQSIGDCGQINGDCFGSATWGSATINPGTNPVQDLDFLNFTGSANSGTTCSSLSNFLVGNGCSTVGVTGNSQLVQVSTQVLPWVDTTPSYYVGYFAIFNLGAQPFYNFLNRPAVTPWNNIGMYRFVFQVPTYTPPPPTIDTGGFFGPVIKALINIGIFIFNGILQFIGFITPAFQTALQVEETVLAVVYDFLGNAMGLGAIGTNTLTFLCGGVPCNGGGILGIITSAFVNGFSFIGAAVNRVLDVFKVAYTWATIPFAIALKLTAFLVGGVGEAVTIATKLINLGDLFVGLGLIIAWFIYVSDYGFSGFQAWVEFFKWLVFGLGIRTVTTIINFTLDVITALIGLIPKPVIQSVAHKLPRFPYIDITGSVAPMNLDGGALREGNIFSILGIVVGTVGAVWYEAQASLPGTIASLSGLGPTSFFATSVNNNVLPFYYLFLPIVFLISFILMIPTLFARVFGGLGVQTGFQELVPVSVRSRGVSISSRSRSGALLVKAKRRFQGRLERKVAEREKIERRARESTEKLSMTREKTEAERKAQEEIRRRELARKPTGRDIKGPRLGPLGVEEDDGK